MLNNVYEQVLNKLRVGFRYEEYIPLNEINASKGLKNQARLVEPLDMELVEQYYQLMKEGHEFPALILWRPGKGMYIPIDGNQRLAAKIKNKDNGTDAYILDTHDEAVAERITKIFNNKVNGKRLTVEEVIQHALTFIRKYSISVDAASKEFGISKSTLANKVKLAELKDVLSINKIPITIALTERALLNLAPLNKVGEEIFVGATKIVSSAGFSAGGASDLTSRVLKAKNYKDKLAVLETVKKSQETKDREVLSSGGKVRYDLPRDKLTRSLSSLRNLLDVYTGKDAIRPVGASFKSAQEDAYAVINRLIPIFGLGRMLDKMEDVG